MSPIGRVPGVGQPYRDEDQPLAAPEGEAPQGARQPDDASGVQPAQVDDGAHPGEAGGLPEADRRDAGPLGQLLCIPAGGPIVAAVYDDLVHCGSPLLSPGGL